MHRYLLTFITVLFFTAQAHAAAVIGPAFSHWSSASGGVVDASKQGTNTMIVQGATFSKPGGKPTLTVPVTFTKWSSATGSLDSSKSGANTIYFEGAATAQRSGKSTVTIDNAAVAKDATNPKFAGGADPTETVSSSAAINAALVGGGVVQLPSGRYKIGSTISVPSGTTLRGTGKGTVFVVPPTGFVGSQVITNSDLAGGNSDITLENFAIEVDAALPVPVPGDGHPGIIRFEKVNGLTLDRIYTTTYNCQLAAIDLTGGNRNVRVTNSAMKNQNTVSGPLLQIRAGSTTDASYDSYNIVISNNIFEGASDESLALYAWMNHLYNVTVTGNTFINYGSLAELAVGFTGHDQVGQTGILTDVVFTGNVVVGRSTIVTGCSRIQYKNNTITGPVLASKDAVFLSLSSTLAPPDNIEVSGNVIQGASRYGIYASGTNIRLIGNKTSGTTNSGIYGGTEVIDNIIDMTGTSAAGITLTEAKSVRGNNVTGGSSGIASLVTLNDVELSGNRLKEFSSTGISFNGGGLTGVTNHALQSEAVGTTPWSTTGVCTVNVDQGTLPGAGSATMDSIQCTANTSGQLQSVFTDMTGTGPFTLSAWVSSLSGTATESIAMNLVSATGVTCSCTRSDAGSCTASTTGTVGFAYGSFGTTPVRLSLTCSSTGAASNVNVVLHDGQYNSTNNVGGLFGGVQLEAAASAGTYVPTTTSIGSINVSSNIRVKNNVISGSSASFGIRSFNGTFSGCTASDNVTSGVSTAVSLASGWLNSAGLAGRTICWKTDGKTLGYCSTQPDASGACTCN